MKFVGKGQPLTRAGLNKALALLGHGVNAAYIWTVVEVETAGLTQVAFASIAGRKFSSSVICLENIRMAASKSSTDRLIRPCVKKLRSALRNDRGRQSFRPLLIPL